MLFTGKEMYVSNAIERNCASCICESVLKKLASSYADLGRVKEKGLKMKAVCAGQK